MSDLLYGGLVVLSEFLFPMQSVLLKSYKYNTLIMTFLLALINSIVFFFNYILLHHL